MWRFIYRVRAHVDSSSRYLAPPPSLSLRRAWNRQTHSRTFASIVRLAFQWSPTNLTVSIEQGWHLSSIGEFFSLVMIRTCSYPSLRTNTDWSLQRNSVSSTKSSNILSVNWGSKQWRRGCQSIFFATIRLSGCHWSTRC